MDTKTKTLRFPLWPVEDDGMITIHPGHDYHPPVFHDRKPPKDNQGRERCYWCDLPTVKRGYWKEYDCCPECQK